MILGSGLDKSADLLPTVFIRHLRVRSERERKRTTAAPKEREREKEVETKKKKEKLNGAKGWKRKMVNTQFSKRSTKALDRKKQAAWEIGLGKRGER